VRFRSFLFLIAGIVLLSSAVAAQPTQPAATPVPTPTPAPTPVNILKLDPKNITAEQVTELAIFFYGGRPGLTQIRKTTLERGVSTIAAADGRADRVPYTRFVIRGDSLAKERIRLEQEYPSARFSLVQTADRTFGIYNNTVFQPAEEALRTFRNQIYHGLEALLRYKENGSQIALAGREKVMGVEYHLLDVTDTEGRKTRFFISVKTYRVMMLTYEEDGIKYRRRFYDYNAAQGTLVPFRTVLWANDKQIEETEIGTVTFGQKVDEGLFNAS
jgi:hypothetical protein